MLSCGVGGATIALYYISFSSLLLYNTNTPARRRAASLYQLSTLREERTSAYNQGCNGQHMHMLKNGEQEFKRSS